jgi:hypothetical protein
MPILPRLFVALLALLSLLAARHLHRQQALRVAPTGLGAPPHRLPAAPEWRPAYQPAPAPRAVVAGAAASPMRLFFLRTL